MVTKPSELSREGRIPTRHLLAAAVKLGRILVGEEVEISQLHASYPHVASDGEFCVEDFLLGEEILVSSGLAQVENQRIRVSTAVSSLGEEEDVACEVLLGLYMARVEPPWLSAATRLGNLKVELIPDTEIRSLATILESPERREAFLLALGLERNEEAHKILGSKGEAFVVDACRDLLLNAGRADLAARVRQVSLESDFLGYDIVSPGLAGHLLRLEVKTTRAEDVYDVSVYISRGEAAVGARDRDWYLVVCSLPVSGEAKLLGWLRGRALLDQLPRDSEDGGRWLRAQIQLPVERMNPGLPLDARQETSTSIPRL